MNGTKKRKEKVGEKSERDRERESKLTAWVKLGTFLSLPCVNTGSFSSTDQPKTIFTEAGQSLLEPVLH